MLYRHSQSSATSEEPVDTAKKVEIKKVTSMDVMSRLNHSNNHLVNNDDNNTTTNHDNNNDNNEKDNTIDSVNTMKEINSEISIPHNHPVTIATHNHNYDISDFVEKQNMNNNDDDDSNRNHELEKQLRSTSMDQNEMSTILLDMQLLVGLRSAFLGVFNYRF